MASNSHPGALIVTARMMSMKGSLAGIANAAITPSHSMLRISDDAAARTENRHEKPRNNMT
jgi:hypothetical protein